MSYSTSGYSRCIYRIVCFATGKVYIGQTIQTKRRRKDHFGALRRGNHFNVYLQRAFNKYGEGAFYFEVLERDVPESKIDERETFWIAEFDSYRNGYNLTSGGGSAARGCKPCFYNGKQWESISAAARGNGLDMGTLRNRLKRGYTSESDMKNHKRLGKKCTWNGVEYNSILEAANANGIDKQRMQFYHRRGWTCKSDIITVTIPTVWEGIEYPSITAAAKANGMNTAKMWRLLKKLESTANA